MWEASFIEQELSKDLTIWRDYALKYPLKALHEALDPSFRRTIITSEPKILSAVLLVMKSRDLPAWTLLFGLYTKKPGLTAEVLSRYPAMQVSGWPGEIRDTVSKAGASLIMKVGGHGDALVQRMQYGIRVTRQITGMEAHWAIEQGLNKYPLLSKG